MRVEIDFDQKIIKVSDKINSKKFIKFLKTLDNWEDYDIDCNTVIEYQYNPIWVNRPYYDLYPYPHYTYPTVVDPCNLPTGTTSYSDGSNLLQFELS